jgi:hypothetical protein
MSEKILTMMKNLWEFLKAPYKYRYGLYILFIPSIFFTINIFIESNLYIHGFLSFILVYFQVYKNNVKFYRDLYKNNVWVKVYNNGIFYWQKLDRRYVKKDKEQLYINLDEISEGYGTKSYRTNMNYSSIDGYYLSNFISYNEKKYYLSNTEDPIFKQKNRDNEIDKLLN